MLKKNSEMKNFLYKLRLFFYFKNPLYNLILEKRLSQKILYSPEDVWSGDSEVGLKIINGYVNFYGESFNFKKNIWEKNRASEFWNDKLHSFDWIKDVRAVGTNRARVFLRNNILEWLKKNKNWNENSWKKDVLAKRITNLLSNLSFFFNTADEEFQIKVAKNLNKQAIYLLNTFNEKKLKENEIYKVKASILASLSFENLNKNLSFSLKKLEEIILNHINEDGMHYLRSPSEHFNFLCSLLDIKNYLGTFKIPIPKKLNSKISQMSSIIKFFRLGNGQLSVFNSYEFIDSDLIERTIKRANSKIKIPSHLFDSGFQRVSENRLILIMDCGTPSIEKTHAGSLSFELSHGFEKIIVNCGSPHVNNKKWSDAMRSTAAHSTLTVDDINSSDIFFNKDTTTRIANVSSERLENEGNYWINSAHSGYEKLFGLIHKRNIHIDGKNLIIRGKDFFKRTNYQAPTLGKPKKFCLRFHIHPDVKLSVTSSKKKAVLKLNNDLGWEFICSLPKIQIKEGIYLGGNRLVERNNHILISDELSFDKEIKWLFRFIQ